MIAPKTNWEREKEKPLVKSAMILTKCDIQKCKQFLTFLDSEKISNDEKKTMSLFIKKVTEAVAMLKNEFDSRNFEISYKHYFGNQTCHQLAWDILMTKVLL